MVSPTDPATSEAPVAAPELESTVVAATVTSSPPAPTTVQSASSARPEIVPIVFDLPTESTAGDSIAASIAKRRAAHEQRAQKFGVPVVPVRETTVLGARRAAIRPGFATGFDVTTAAEAERRAKRAVRFGTTSSASSAPVSEETVNESTPVAVVALERRRMAVVGETLRENVLQVFGVDNLSTSDILRHFRDYGPSWVEWLNDSSCNIAFEDTHSVRRVLKFFAAGEETFAPAGDAMGDEEGDGQSAPVAAVDGALDEALEWREAVPVKGRSGAFVLWMRMATDKDVRPEKPNPRSKWSRTVLRERRISGGDQGMDKVDGNRRMQSRRRRRTRSRNELKGVSGARVEKKESKTKVVDIDMPLSSK